MSMKRGSDRDPSPVSKKSRSSLGRYDDSSDDDRSIRKPPRGRSPSPRPRYGPPDLPASSRDEYARSRASNGYKVLCVSSVHPKASDEVVKDSLYREFKKYGEVTIKLMKGAEPEDRLAYVYFRNPEDAREARHSKQRIIVYDKAVIVEPVYENPARSRPRSRSYSPLPDRYDDRYRPRSPYDRVYEDRYDYPPRGYPPPGPYRDYRPPPYEYSPRGHPYHGGHHRAPYYGHPPMHSSYRGYDRFENKKDRFPNYLHHISPEEDPLATRTLFAGNLEINITEDELRRIFTRYGVVEDIDIKRPPPGTGNAYAFVRFENLDQANRCKVELSGQYIGKFQVKIGYGKATPSTRIWVGGLGSWTSLAQLEREFDRFGAIKKIEYSKGDNCAYILYETIEAAQAAVQDMRGFPLGGADRRLRTDFADPNPPPSGFATKPSKSSGGYAEGSTSKEDYPPGFPAGYGEEYYGRGRERNRGYDKRGGNRNSPEFDEWNRRPPPPDDFDGGRRSRSPGSPGRRSDDEVRDDVGAIAAARTLAELTRKATSTWSGALVLKNSLFPTKLHLTAGESSIVDLLLKDDDGKSQLRITQRLRLDPPKLEDVSRRVSASASHAIFLGMPTSTPNSTNDESVVQTRPLRNLVSYLKQKEAAGVISLNNKEADITGVLYAFPPCAFATEMLRKTATSLSEETLKEDYLVVVVVKGGSA